MTWKTLNTKALIKRSDKQVQETTTSASVGGYVVPLGAAPLVRAPIAPYKIHKPKKNS